MMKKRETVFKKLTKRLFAEYMLVTNPDHKDFGKYKFIRNCWRNDMIKATAKMGS